MAIGLPVKANYAAGDILTATNMNDLSGTFNNVATSYGNAAGKNKCLNSDYSIWQRGTSGFTNGSLTADRWYYYADGTGTKAVTRQTFTPGSAPVSGYEGKYFWRMTQSTAGTGGTLNITWQRIEDVQTFAGQTVTFSFWAKADAARTISVGLNQNFGSGGSSAVAITGTNFSATTSWTRFSYTVAIPSIAGKTIGTSSYFEVQIGMPSNVVQTIDIWGVQVEAGSIATPFQTASGGSIQSELAMCQRYYWRNTTGSTYGAVASAYVGTTTQVNGLFIFPVPMRITPSQVEQGNLEYIDFSGGSGALSSPSYSPSESTPLTARVNFTVSGATAGRGAFIRASNNTAAYIGFTSEL